MDTIDEFNKHVQVRYTNERGTESRIHLIKFLADYLTENGINRRELIQKLHDQIIEKHKKKHGIEGRANLAIPEINRRITREIWKMVPDEDEWDTERSDAEPSGLMA